MGEPISSIIILIVIAVTSAVAAAASITSTIHSAAAASAADPKKVKGIYYSFAAAMQRGEQAYAMMCERVAALNKKYRKNHRSCTTAITVDGTDMRLPMKSFTFKILVSAYSYRFRLIPKFQQGSITLTGYEVRILPEPIPPKVYWDYRDIAFERAEKMVIGAVITST